MTETRQIAILMAITLIIGVVALALALSLPQILEGNLVVDRYDAAISPDGTLTERYTYVVKAPGTYRMLFRTWEVPLAGAPLTQPSIELIGMHVPSGTIGYYRDYQGQVTIYGMTTDKTRFEWEKVPFGRSRLEHIQRVDTHAVEDPGKLVDKRNVDIPL